MWFGIWKVVVKHTFTFVASGVKLRMTARGNTWSWESSPHMLWRACARGSPGLGGWRQCDQYSVVTSNNISLTYLNGIVLLGTTFSSDVLSCFLKSVLSLKLLEMKNFQQMLTFYLVLSLATLGMEFSLISIIHTGRLRRQNLCLKVRLLTWCQVHSHWLRAPLSTTLPPE